MNNPILITGGSGFIGFHFHQKIKNNLITNLDLIEPKFNYNSTFIQGDIRKQGDVEKAIVKSGAKIILSLAAEHKDFGISRQSYFDTNQYGTEVLCKAASKHKIKNIIYYSSVAVYGNNKEPSDEEMLPNPNLPYGESKLAGEHVLKEWASKDSTRKVTIIRPTVVFGERNVANMFRLIHQIKAGRYFHIGKGSNIKSIAYVKNIVDATLFLFDKMEKGVEIYNYADNPQLTSREIANTIAKTLKAKPIQLPYWVVQAMGIPFDILIKLSGKDLPISTNRIKKLCTETYHKAEKIIQSGFSPKYTTVQGLHNMIDWQINEYNTQEYNFDI